MYEPNKNVIKELEKGKGTKEKVRPEKYTDLANLILGLKICDFS